MDSFGDRLFTKISDSRGLLFVQGEMAQLTYQAYDKFVRLIEEDKEEEIPITFPIGFNPDKTPINATHNYSKQELIGRYNYLGLTHLPTNGIFQLVTITETLFGDILRATLIEFPVKISNKKQLNAEVIFGANSLDEVKLSIVNSLLNEIAYKSPKEFAEEFNKYVGLNLLEKPAFHRYAELKATRDIHIHNSGITNEIYLAKAETLSRVKKAGEFLPVTIQYFLESYEYCLQLTEILEEELNKIWPSVKYQEYKKGNAQENEKSEKIDEVIEKSKEESTK